MKEQAADTKEQQDSEFNEEFENEEDVNEAFSDPGVLKRDQLELLAGRFDIEKPHALSDAALRDLLTKKAEEYLALKAEVDSIDEGMKRLSNLKGAAQGAIARVDLEEVEKLLSLVQAVELDEAAKTAELRANNALLRGNVEQAFQILSAAADSFSAVDALEPARRRISYEERLCAHGLRYGGQGMALSEAMLRNAINDLDRTDQAGLWAHAQNSLAIALRNQGTRTAGDAGTTLLANAVTAYRAALTVYTEADHPVDWAMTQNNLGIALEIQGTRNAGTAGTALLADAVAAYRAALTVYTEADHPVDWAMTQNNLGAGLENQGTRTAGAAGTALLADAVTAYRAALTVRTEADHPLDWALTQENLAMAEITIADQETTTDLRTHLQAALAHVDAALIVYDPEHMSHDHGTATLLRDRILSRLENLS